MEAVDATNPSLSNADEDLPYVVSNWPGYDFPLACRVLKESDAQLLFPVMKRSANHLKGFIGWAKYAPSWNFKTVQQFVRDHCNDDWPRFHLIFSIGKQVVGFGSLAPMANPRHIQVALWVAAGWERRGIGQWIVTVLEWYAFNVFGFDRVYYQHDATNRKSGALPKRMGFTFSHSFDEEIQAINESGFWFSWYREKPLDTPPGFIDTGTLENWSEVSFPWSSLI